MSGLVGNSRRHVLSCRGSYHSLFLYTEHCKFTVMLLRFQTDRSGHRQTGLGTDKQVWAKTADPREQSEEGLHCLQFSVHLLNALLYGKATFELT